MKTFVYTAFRVFGLPPLFKHPHVTTSFTEVRPGLPRIELKNRTIRMKVDRIEHWLDANVTVAILDDVRGELLEQHNALIGSGLEYNYEFLPHVTLCNGNNTGLFTDDDYCPLVGNTVYLEDPYIGFVDRDI